MSISKKIRKNNNLDTDKGFYRFLPSRVIVIMDGLEEKYKHEDWFTKAWEEYKMHVITTNKKYLRMPGFIFNKYIKGDK